MRRKVRKIKLPPRGIYSSHVGKNDHLIREVSRLYLPEGCRVADITYGRGAFWRQLDTNDYEFFPSDLVTVPKRRYDFTKKLPYDADSFDVVVFDPPYTHNPGNMLVNNTYQLKETTTGFYHKDIIELYRKGMQQAIRILKPGGTLWVKCKDEIEAGRQCISHIEIYEIALKELSLIAKDLFVLTQEHRPVIQFEEQQHARKNHSYLWIFLKSQD